MSLNSRASGQAQIQVETDLKVKISGPSRCIHANWTMLPLRGTTSNVQVHYILYKPQNFYHIFLFTFVHKVQFMLAYGCYTNDQTRLLNVHQVPVQQKTIIGLIFLCVHCTKVSHVYWVVFNWLYSITPKKGKYCIKMQSFNPEVYTCQNKLYKKNFIQCILFSS